LRRQPLPNRNLQHTGCGVADVQLRKYFIHRRRRHAPTAFMFRPVLYFLLFPILFWDRSVIPRR
jgi:hypothetical protein